MTVTQSIHVGLYRSCQSAGVGLMFCEHIHFDPAACAMVVISPKPPSKSAMDVLRNLATQVQAQCLAPKESPP